jgi:hypothetical protein
MTRVHHLNRWILVLLIALHVAAVLMHWAIRRDNLVAAMVHGRRRGGSDDRVRIAPMWLAIVLLAISAIAVALVVALGASA